VLKVGPVGDSPSSLVVADVNGDAKPDTILIADASAVSVGLGNGDGSFRPAAKYPTAKGSNEAAVADVNDDGKVDVVTAGFYLGRGGAVSVLLGDGDGTFRAPVDYTLGDFAIAVAIGDVNGDGKVDIATAETSGISVLLGKGDGKFRTAVSYPAGGAVPWSIALVDLNRDGKADVIATNSGSLRSQSNNVAVLLARPDGGLNRPTNYAAGPCRWTDNDPDGILEPACDAIVAIGDLDGDRNPDLAATNENTGQVWVLHGTSSGRLTRIHAYRAGESGSQDVRIADVSNDHRPDLLVTSYAGPGSLSILVATRKGGFRPASHHRAKVPSELATADLNGDGRADVLVLNDLESTVSVLLNTSGSKQ
jgi:hypothetical protein